MKIIIAFTFIIFALTSRADVKNAKKLFNKQKQTNLTQLKIAKELINAKYYYSSLLFVKSYLSMSDNFPPEESTQRNVLEKILEKLILKTGTMAFSYMPSGIIQHQNKSPSLALAYAVKLTQNKEYEKALSVLQNIPNDHRFAPEARMLEGASKVEQKDFKGAQKAYQECRKNAENISNLSEHQKMKRYYNVLNNSCLAHLARIKYQKGNFEKADKVYEKIPKTSYRWPYILIEQAWAHYNLKDYNRSLGILVTYKSPLLKSYFLPEAEVLRALNYFRLCLWDDAEEVINHYYNDYNKKSEKLRSLLKKHKDSKTFFLRLATTPISKNENKNIFIRNLLTQIRKKVKFNVDLVAYKRLRNEIRHVQKFEKSQLQKVLLRELKHELKFRIEHLNNYIKTAMYDFINEMHRYSYEMFNIKLEISSRKRDLVYDNKKLVSNRSRGDLSHVNRKKNELFFDFRGEFWADELGDYSFGLKSNCKKVESEGEVSWR